MWNNGHSALAQFYLSVDDGGTDSIDSEVSSKEITSRSEPVATFSMIAQLVMRLMVAGVAKAKSHIDLPRPVE